MLCSKCGKENDSKNKFCSNCGAVLDNTPSQSMPKHKGGKKIFLLGIFCCLIIISIFSFKAYSKYSTYQSGIKSFNSGDYETAKKTFASISDYKDSSNYIDECTYQQALVDLNNKTYDNAIIAFEALGDYKDSTTCLEKAKMERKYSLFNQDIDSDTVDLNTILDSPDSVEENISPLYKEWYNSSTGESLVIDAFQINGRDYMVKYVTILDGWADTVFCYVDEPDHTFDILPYFDYFDYISESVDTVDIYDPKSADSEHYVRSAGRCTALSCPSPALYGQGCLSAPHPPFRQERPPSLLAEPDGQGSFQSHARRQYQRWCTRLVPHSGEAPRPAVPKKSYHRERRGNRNRLSSCRTSYTATCSGA